MAEITVNIPSEGPVIAANLDELRYLVFRGLTGDAGQSAYELAVSLGFQGTEREWLESLSGLDGKDGRDGKNYGVVVDGSEEDILELKSVELQGGGALGAERAPMDDLTANELLDCIYSYIDNADKLFYGGMNARYIAACTDLETVKAAIQDIVDVSSASTLAEVKAAVDALTDPEINSVRLALHIGGSWATENPRAAVDYLLSGRKPIHCAWFAYLISSGIRYETSLYAGNAEAKQFYDWGFDWADYESNGYPLANLEAKYCVEQGYGFTPDSADFHELRTGDILFFANGSDDSYGNIGHVGVFLYHNADGKKCTVVDVSSEAPDGTNTTYPIQVKTYGYDSAVMQKCTIAARLPYAGSGRVGQPKNLFADEAACRDLARALTAGSAVFAKGSFAEGLKRNRFYTFAICLERASDIDDDIRLQGVGSSNSGVIGTTIDAAPGDRADGVYAITIFNGRYRSPSYAMYTRLDGSGLRFRSVAPGGDSGTGVPQEATVKWIACYAGIHHVGRSGFVPYFDDDSVTITQQPADAWVPTSGTAVFHVEAKGAGLTYQWQYRLSASDGWANCSAATAGYNTDTISVAAAKTNGTRDGYGYRCVITDTAGNTYESDPAALHVLQSAMGGWRELTEEECPDGGTMNIDTVYSRRFWVCETLGMVRFVFTALSDAPTGSGGLTAGFYFAPGKHFKPYFDPTYSGDYPVVSTGVASVSRGGSGQLSAPAAIAHRYTDSGEDFVSVDLSQITGAAKFTVSGFYYTEDIPTASAGGEA